MGINKLIGAVTNYDKIVAYMRDPENPSTELSPHQKALMDRWIAAYTMLRNYNSIGEAIPLHKMAFKGISTATAYRDFENAISLFGDSFAAKREGIKHLITEIILDSIKMARGQNKPAIMIQGAEKLAIVHGLNRDESEAMDYSKFERHNIVFTITEDAKKAIEKLTEKGVIDLDLMNNLPTEEGEILHYGKSAEHPE